MPTKEQYAKNRNYYINYSRKYWNIIKDNLTEDFMERRRIVNKRYRENNKDKRKESISKYLKNHKLERKLTLLLATAKQRCNNPKFKGYEYYGGRGIKCFLTMEDIKLFWKRDKGSKMKCATLDRINPDWHYTRENCRVLERSENSRRSRHNYFKKNGMVYVK